MAYTILGGTLSSNLTLTAGTYYLNAHVICNYYTVTFDCSAGNIIIKLPASYKMFVDNGIINTINSSESNKVIWTVKDDNSIGETIDGSTGSPSNYQYGPILECRNYPATITNWEIRYFRNEYYALQIVNSTNKNFTIENIVFKNCYFKNSDYLLIDFRPTSYQYGVFKHVKFDSSCYFQNSCKLLRTNFSIEENEIFVESVFENLPISIGYTYVQDMMLPPARYLDFLTTDIIQNKEFSLTSEATSQNQYIDIEINLVAGEILTLDPTQKYKVTSFSVTGILGNNAKINSLQTGTSVEIDLTNFQNETISYLDVKDVKLTNGTITIINGTDLGNNTGFNFTLIPENLVIDLSAGETLTLNPYQQGYLVTAFSCEGSKNSIATINSSVVNTQVDLDFVNFPVSVARYTNFQDINVKNGVIICGDGNDLGNNNKIYFIDFPATQETIEILVGEEEIMIVQPKLTPYIVTSFSMIGSNGRPATLKSSVKGTPVILDMSSFPISNLEYCDFQDIVLQNGTIVSTNGKDLGGNTGITFQQTEIPEDCVDWKITEELINQLSTMSTGYNTQVKTVQLIESEFKSPSEFPVLIVCPNEIDPEQEYASRNDTLPFALIYIDDSTETNLHYRFRNVPADVQKCLKKNETLNYLAHYVKVDNWENSVFVINDIEFACCIIYVSVERRLDASDPYKLA